MTRAWSGTALVVSDDQVVDQRSAGVVAGPDSVPCSPQTRFQAGSVSKLVLSCVVLQLVERHELDLHEPISRWLTTAPPSWRPITLHQLLSNTSGLGHWGDVPGLPPILATPPPRDELMAKIAATPLVHRPGSRWHYSGPGFLVASLVVEAATRTAYRYAAHELVIGPAALLSTTSGEYPAVDGPDVATGHHQGLPVHVDPGFADLPGTGDLWTTAGDLIRLNQTLRAGQLISRTAVAQLWTPHSMVDASLGVNADTGPILTAAYGYGTFLGQINGHRARISPGDNPGYQSLLAYLPDRGLDIAVLCNEDPPSVNAALRELSIA